MLCRFDTTLKYEKFNYILDIYEFIANHWRFLQSKYKSLWRVAFALSPGEVLSAARVLQATCLPLVPSGDER